MLNDGKKAYKVEKVVCFAAIAVTLCQDNHANLKLLILKAHTWVVSEFDIMCELLTTEFESETYEKLMSKDTLSYRKPVLEEIHRSRKAQ